MDLSTIAEFSKEENIPIQTIHSYIKEKKISPQRIGSIYVLTRSDCAQIKKLHRRRSDLPVYLRSKGFHNNRQKGTRRGWWKGERYYGLTSSEAAENYLKAVKQMEEK